jgi:hydrogenase maturation protease
MNLDLVNQIANAVLYEGYMLYPYRPTAVKNQQRWNFGVLYPPSYSSLNPKTESSTMQTECMVLFNEATALEVRVRFLHLRERQIWKMSRGTDDFEPVDTLDVEGQLFQTWQEAVEREVMVPELNLLDLIRESKEVEFSFDASLETETLNSNGLMVGKVSRKHERVSGSIVLAANVVNDRLAKITVAVSNRTDGEFSTRDQALLSSTVSTHTILVVSSSEFVSQLDPPEEFRSASTSCNNIGTWPVLVGKYDEKDTMLSAPIILYDYPQVAPESAGNLFDGTEIDEILTLRIMTLTDEEKREMRGSDERARQILERTETLPVEQFMKMHGGVKQVKS